MSEIFHDSFRRNASAPTFHHGVDICTECKAEIHASEGQQVVFGNDLKFCSEGCRCVYFSGEHSNANGVIEDDEDMALIGKGGFENPCLHCDAYCPHFASMSVGLVKNKWGFNRVFQTVHCLQHKGGDRCLCPLKCREFDEELEPLKRSVSMLPVMRLAKEEDM